MRQSVSLAKTERFGTTCLKQNKTQERTQSTQKEAPFPPPPPPAPPSQNRQDTKNVKQQRPRSHHHPPRTQIPRIPKPKTRLPLLPLQTRPRPKIHDPRSLPRLESAPELAIRPQPPLLRLHPRLRQLVAHMGQSGVAGPEPLPGRRPARLGT